MVSFQKTRGLYVTSNDGLSSKMPIRLKDGEEASYFTNLEESDILESLVNNLLSPHPKLKCYFFKAMIHTSVGVDFKVKIEKGLRDKLLQTIEQLNKNAKTGKS